MKKKYGNTFFDMLPRRNWRLLISLGEQLDCDAIEIVLNGSLMPEIKGLFDQLASTKPFLTDAQHPYSTLSREAMHLAGQVNELTELIVRLCFYYFNRRVDISPAINSALSWVKQYNQSQADIILTKINHPSFKKLFSDITSVPVPVSALHK